MPTVSVLMAFHRITPYLPIAVRSVLEQTWSDLELILVDDGTGLGLAPLGEMGADPRVVLVSHPRNLGIAAAVNAARTKARGDFIALLDHDDVALPARIERQIAVLRNEPHLGLVSGYADRVDATGRVTGREFALLSPREQYAFSAYTNPAAAPSYTGRREVFEQFPWRVEIAWASDYDFLARAAEAWPMRCIPEVVVQYRVHAEQTSATHYREQVFHACIVRMLTARRRTGREEDLPGLLALLGPLMTRVPEVAESFQWFARQALTEQLPLLSVYFARKLLSVRRRPGQIGFASRVVVHALRQSPQRSGQLLRMFFTGPLRTHRLVRRDRGAG